MGELVETTAGVRQAVGEPAEPHPRRNFRTGSIALEIYCFKGNQDAHT